MKKILCILCVVCLLLSACSRGESHETGTTETVTSHTTEESTLPAPEAGTGAETETEDNSVPQPEEENSSAPQPEVEDSSIPQTEEEAGSVPPTEGPSVVPVTPAPTISGQMPGLDMPESDLVLGEGGRIRLDYIGNRSGVQYITEAGQVPDYEELAGYDEAYFLDKALLVVMVTTGSGSIRTEIGAVQIDGGTASVHVSYTMTGDVGTADMATWLMWVEVEAGLDYQWKLAGETNAGDQVYSS